MTPGTDYVATAVEGGPARRRRDLIGTSSRVNVTWIVGSSDYNYLRSFYRLVRNGGDSFLIDLILDTPDPVEKTANFTSGLNLTNQSGFQYTLEAELEVQ